MSRAQSPKGKDSCILKCPTHPFPPPPHSCSPQRQSLLPVSYRSSSHLCEYTSICTHSLCVYTNGDALSTLLTPFFFH